MINQPPPTKTTYSTKLCNKSLADGQWWNFCGETDMGQTDPVRCTHCGGKFIREEDVSHSSVMEVLNAYRKDSFEQRKERFPNDNSQWLIKTPPEERSKHDNG